MYACIYVYILEIFLLLFLSKCRPTFSLVLPPVLNSCRALRFRVGFHRPVSYIRNAKIVNALTCAFPRLQWLFSDKLGRILSLSQSRHFHPGLSTCLTLALSLWAYPAMYVYVYADASIHVYIRTYNNREGAPGTTSQVLRIKREETRSFGMEGLFSRTSCRAHTPGCVCVWYVYVYEYGCHNRYVDVDVHSHVYMSSCPFYPFPSQRTKFFGNDSGRLILCRSIPWTWNSTQTSLVLEQSSRSSSPRGHGHVEHRCQAGIVI